VAILDPSSQPSPERDERLRANTTRVEIRPVERVAHLATRSMACPSCELPVRIAGPVGLGSMLECPFCESIASTRAYIREEGWPEVQLIARLP
jgi:hypothetical protein